MSVVPEGAREAAAPALLWPAYVLGLLLSMTLVALPAPSQAVEGRHQAWVNAGFASTWLVQVGGGFRLGEGVRLDVQLDTPLVRPLVMGGRLALGLSVLRPFGDWFGLAGRVELGAPWSSDFSGSWLAVDVRAGLQPGLYRRTWALALDVSVVPTLAASWTPSLVVRDSFGDRPGSAVQSPRTVGLSFPAFRVDVGALARFRLVKTDVARLWLLVNASLVVTPSRVGPAMPPTSTLPFTMGLGAACEL